MPDCVREAAASPGGIAVDIDMFATCTGDVADDAVDCRLNFVFGHIRTEDRHQLISSGITNSTAQRQLLSLGLPRTSTSRKLRDPGSSVAERQQQIGPTYGPSRSIPRVITRPVRSSGQLVREC